MLNKLRSRRPIDLPVESWKRTLPIRLLIGGLAALILVPLLASLLVATVGVKTAGPVLIAAVIGIPILVMFMRLLGGSAVATTVRVFLVIALVLGVTVWGALRGGVAALPLIGLVSAGAVLLVTGLAAK